MPGLAVGEARWRLRGAWTGFAAVVALLALAGIADASEPASASAVPGAPLDVSANMSPYPSIIEVRWNPPAVDGGSPILEYRVCQPRACETVDASDRVVYDRTGPDGETVTFTVAARNAAGWGPNATSGPATRIGMPDVWRPGVDHLRSELGLRVSWAPSTDGGAPIETYTVWGGANFSTLQVLATVPASVREFSDTTVPPNTMRWYAVSATNAYFTGYRSPSQNGTTLHAAPDCDTGLDAPESGMRMLGLPHCKGGLGPGDTVDVIAYELANNSYVQLVNVTGPVVHVVTPDGETRPVVDGHVRAVSRAAGTWRVVARVEAPTTQVTWSYRAVHTLVGPQDSSTSLAVAHLVDIREPLRASVGVVDKHRDPVTATVHWGDGATTIVPFAAQVGPPLPPVALAHAYAEAGDYQLTVVAVARDGGMLPTTTRTVRVALPDDCGAGDAPGSGEGHRLAEGSCIGRVGPADTDDVYLIDLGPGPAAPGDEPVFRIVVRPGQGDGSLNARLSWMPLEGGQRMLSDGQVTRERRADGTIVFTPTAALAAHRYVLVVSVWPGSNVYDITLETSKEDLLAEEPAPRPAAGPPAAVVEARTAHAQKRG